MDYGMLKQRLAAACERLQALLIGQHSEERESAAPDRMAALREGEEEFRTIFEEAPIGIALMNEEGRVLSGNPALGKILGYSSEELERENLAQLMCLADDHSENESYLSLIEGRTDSYSVERRHARKNGQNIWIDLNVSRVERRYGESRFVIAMFKDITAQKVAQKALVRNERLAALGKLATSLAHEINNPLQSVIGLLGLTEERLAQGGDVSRYLEVAQQEVRRAADTVVRMRDLGRRSRPEERRRADVNDLVERVLVLTKKKRHDGSVDLDWQPGMNLPSPLVVSDGIMQVLLNLTLNAIEAMPEGGQLSVSTAPSSEPEGICIEVSDTGVGIAEEALERVFEPFESSKPDGLGMGLYVSRTIVEDHGGYIDFESHIGKGSTFRVWLPA